MEQRGTHCLQEQFVTGYFFIYVRANAVRLYSGSRINRRPVLDAKPAQITRGLRDISCSREQAAWKQPLGPHIDAHSAPMQPFLSKWPYTAEFVDRIRIGRRGWAVDVTCGTNERAVRVGRL